MALVIHGVTTCPLCGSVLNASDDLFGTVHFIGDEADPLWKYSDAAMHQQCFLAWEHRPAFVAKYNATVGQEVWGNGTRQKMQLDGSIIFEQVRTPEAR